MKQLYYNPIEPPQKVRLKASCFNVDVEYSLDNSNGKPVYMEELFYLSKSNFFETVEVYLTSHNDAYVKNDKKAPIGIRALGWFSLKEYNNGGACLEDQHILTIKD